MKIYLIRHGETNKNIAGRTHAQGDIEELNDSGLKQAQLVAKVLAKSNITTVISSPEKRAVQTAEVIARELELKVQLSSAFIERDWGSMNGLEWDKIKSVLEPMNIEQRYRFVPEGGESWKAMESRMYEGLIKAVKECNGDLVIVTHAGAIRGLMPKVKQESLESSFTYDFTNCSITELSYNNDAFLVVRENDVTHLS